MTYHSIPYSPDRQLVHALRTHRSARSLSWFSWDQLKLYSIDPDSTRAPDTLAWHQGHSADSIPSRHHVCWRMSLTLHATSRASPTSLQDASPMIDSAAGRCLNHWLNVVHTSCPTKRARSVALTLVRSLPLRPYSRLLSISHAGQHNMLSRSSQCARPSSSLFSGSAPPRPLTTATRSRPGEAARCQLANG